MITKKASGAAGLLDPAGLFEEIARRVTAITGVQLGIRQKTMVETRVRKRIMDLGLKGDAEYAEYFWAHLESETGKLVSLLTTHHTYFFREFAHFEALEQKVLPAMIASARAKGQKKIRIWSAACSRGQEVYSLSMFLAALLPRLAPDFTYEILGTDIDPESVSIAKNGVYHRNELKEAPLSLVGNHWSRGTGDISDYVKAKASIKAPCRFEVANLIDLTKTLLTSEFDIIFCRNVFIYFTPEQIKSISENLLKALSPGGYVFVGISETLNGLNLPVSYQGPSVYSKPLPKSEVPAKSTAVAASLPAPSSAANVLPIRSAVTAQARGPLRVMCVDDSPSVIALLKKILTAENGFEVVATAANGLEAAQKLKATKVDVVTLDIHMPEQTGLEYLKKNFGPSHPPVVMITSVSRDDTDLAFQCLKGGASDFVEKPALNNLSERGDEIRTKLVCAVQSRAVAPARDLSLDQAFNNKPVIKNPEKAFRAIVATYSSWDKLAAFFKESKATCANQPATVIFVEGAKNVLGEYAKSLAQKTGYIIETIEGAAPALKPGMIYVADFASMYDPLISQTSDRKTSVLIYGGVSKHGTAKLTQLQRRVQLLVEDLGAAADPSQKALAEKATDLIPATSFAYMSTHFLSMS